MNQDRALGSAKRFFGAPPAAEPPQSKRLPDASRNHVGFTNCMVS